MHSFFHQIFSCQEEKRTALVGLWVDGAEKEAHSIIVGLWRIMGFSHANSTALFSLLPAIIIGANEREGTDSFNDMSIYMDMLVRDLRKAYIAGTKLYVCVYVCLCDNTLMLNLEIMGGQVFLSIGPATCPSLGSRQVDADSRHAWWRCLPTALKCIPIP
jgi:hypothetical protein